MFDQQLKQIIDRMDGGIGGLIMGLDGIPVASYLADNSQMDITTLGMEFSFILAQARKASDILKLGGVVEFSVCAESLVLAIRMLSPEYFLAVALRTDGNLGKARYLMRLHQPRLSAEL